METNDKNLGDKKWNNEDLNEGFSSENLPENYNEENPLMTTEIETDQFGNETEVKRARFPHQHDGKFLFDTPDNSAIENKKSVENRDRNYDIADNRYPHSNPESHRNRGNFDVNDDGKR